MGKHRQELILGPDGFREASGRFLMLVRPEIFSEQGLGQGLEELGLHLQATLREWGLPADGRPDRRHR
jgi:hypothetical protein